MDGRIELTGSTPLLAHNARLADPDDEFVKAIAELTGKRKKTEDDRRAVAKLEWHGGLYVNGAGPVWPTANIRRCLVEAAKVTKQGKQVGRALAFADVDVPIAYEGPRELDQLYERPEFHHRASVRIGSSRTMRTRPCFPRWALAADFTLVTEALDPDDLERVIERAGVIEGLGDNRINGYGRFEGKVSWR
jgi:hypothetical protein